MSLALAAAIPGDASPEQRDRDQQFVRALDTLLSHSGATHTARDVVTLAEGPGGLIHGNVTDRLLRAGLPSHTADLVVRTVTAAHELTAWWPAERTRVQAPADLAAIAQPIFGRSPQEQLHIAIVDGRNGLLDLHHVYTGTATGTSVRIGELLRPVLEAHGVGFAAVHNHPSGELTPSHCDIDITKRLREVGDLFGTPITDHIIVGHNPETDKWHSCSLRERSPW